jgi:GAF domain-containing protein
VRFTNRYRHAAGRYLLLEWNARAILEEQAIYAVARDVTERVTVANPCRAAEFVSATTAALTAGDGLVESLRAVAERAVDHLGAALACVWTLTEDAVELELRASAGLLTESEARVAVGDVGRIARERTPLVANSVADQEWAVRHGITAFAGFPLTVGDRALGVFAAFARRPLAEEALEALRAVASCLALRVWADAGR